jgi:hypothetical protein
MNSEVINKKPLIITMNGGLGNQLFMLFAGISKAIDEKRDYLIYLEQNERHFYFTTFLNHLNSKVINYNNYNIQVNNIYNEPCFKYCSIPNDIDMLRGYYQSYKYFEHNYEQIREEFKLNENKDKYKLNIRAIAIHFRLGDYLNLTHYHNVLSFLYYIKAIKYLISNINDIDEYKFIIFGEKVNDDLINEYIYNINHNLDKPIDFIKIYDLYPNAEDHEELFYMSNCQHFIIGNSTFSWFGAYLCNNQDKIVIHPAQNKWFSRENNLGKNNELDDLFKEKWIEIDY